MSKTIAFLFVLALAPAVALAQTPATEPAPPAASSDAFAKGTLGLAFPVTLLSNVESVAGGGEAVQTIDFIYFLDPKSALDIIVGLNLHKEQVLNNAIPPVSEDKTLLGFALGLGYRMYRKPHGPVLMYIEPAAILTWEDTSNSALVDIALTAQLGVERMLVDWLSVSGAIGVGVDFTNEFKDIQLATTASLAVNLYWR